jgi:hypothetical protein
MDIKDAKFQVLYQKICSLYVGKTLTSVWGKFDN